MLARPYASLEILSYVNRRLERSQNMSLNSDIPERAQAEASGWNRLPFGLGAALSRSNPRLQNWLAAAPPPSAVLLVLLGMILGMATAYMILPTEFTGASPRHLSEQAIQQWVRMVAVGHSQNIHYDDSNALLVLQQIPNPQETVLGLAESARVPTAERVALSALTTVGGFEALTGTAAPQDPGLLGSALQVLLALAIVAVALPLLAIAWRAVNPGSASNADGKSQGFRTLAVAQEQAGAADIYDDETERSGVQHPQYGAPILHTVSSYVKGQMYDDSYALELSPQQDSQFLGECHVSTATQVGGELQSVEVWSFDMASQQTTTKVFAAPAAIADPNFQAALVNRVQDPFTDILPAEVGRRVNLESNSLLVQADVKSVVYNYGGGLPNSGIESLQIELLVWQRQNLRTAVPASRYPTAADSPVAEYVDLRFNPPARREAPAPPPGVAGSSAPTGKAPPSKRPEDEDDDPFGGTGNFMPFS